MTTLVAEHYCLAAAAAIPTAQTAHRRWHEDPRAALEIVYCHEDIDEDAPPNLVYLPLNVLAAYFIDNTLPLPSAVDFTGTDITATSEQEIAEVFAAALASVAAVRANMDVSGDGTVSDAYFLDRRTALLTAWQRNRVRLKHPTVTGLQICYFDGDAQPGDPENLIAVKAEDFMPFFTSCRLRFPTRIVPPPQVTTEQRRALNTDFKALFTEIHRQKEVIAIDLVAKAREFKPRPIAAATPLRVMLPSNRQTTVMQYVSRNLAHALERNGHQVMVSIEQNEMENIDTQAFLEDYLAFKPQVVFNINHENNYFLHDDVHNIIWWQDPMPALQRGDRLALRPRDHMLSYSPQIDDLLTACGARQVARQHFCIDPQIFRVDADIERGDRAVFVGSSYRNLLHANPRDHQLLERLYRMFQAGDVIDRDIVERMADEIGVDRHHAFWHLLHYTVRDLSVRWLCQSSPIPVEVYGRGWEEDEFVAPFHHGQLAHGRDVARVYNSARYALVVHPFEVNSQRLAEASACGCIPVVYDCRHSAEAPYWASRVCYYRTEQQLVAALKTQPALQPADIGREFTYQRLAERVAELVGDGGSNADSTLGTLASMK